MNRLLFAIADGATFAWRYVGLWLQFNHMSSFWAQFMNYVPMSIFTALIISSLYTAPELLTLKVVALIAAGVVAWRTRQFGLGVITGLSVLWMLSLVSTS